MAVKRTITFDDYYAEKEGTVKEIGNSAHVLVPRSWLGKKVTVILREPLKESE